MFLHAWLMLSSIHTIQTSGTACSSSLSSPFTPSVLSFPPQGQNKELKWLMLPAWRLTNDGQGFLFENHSILVKLFVFAFLMLNPLCCRRGTNALILVQKKDSWLQICRMYYLRFLPAVSFLREHLTNIINVGHNIADMTGINKLFRK